MNKKRVLFICIHNSARSQMAQEFVNKLGADRFEAESAGLEPGKLNPIVVDAMKDVGIDISGNKTRSVFSLYEQGREYDYVITVCDEGNSERCPIFPGGGKRMHWPFADPSSFDGSYEEKLNKTKEVRDEIKEQVQKWLLQPDI